MEIVVKVCVIYLFVVAANNLISGPFMIGKPRLDYGPWHYVGAGVVAVAIVIVCGRAIGWW